MAIEEFEADRISSRPQARLPRLQQTQTHSGKIFITSINFCLKATIKRNLATLSVSLNNFLMIYCLDR